ncbi:hypothetical protein EDB84DRAFT_1679723 [Lactarius hengduanensis]|nr:hypothetical protein EDB84DRAFT_1679723 [Lactarius hengduanensis]
MARATSRKGRIFEPISGSQGGSSSRRRRYARDSNLSEDELEDIVSTDDESDAHSISRQRHAKLYNSQSDDGKVPLSCLGQKCHDFNSGCRLRTWLGTLILRHNNEQIAHPIRFFQVGLEDRNCQKTSCNRSATGLLVARAVPVSRVRGYFAGTQITGPEIAASNTVLSRCDADTAPWRFDTDTAPSSYDIDAAAATRRSDAATRPGALTLRHRHSAVTLRHRRDSAATWRSGAATRHGRPDASTPTRRRGTPTPTRQCSNTALLGAATRHGARRPPFDTDRPRRTSIPTRAVHATTLTRRRGYTDAAAQPTQPSGAATRHPRPAP